MQIKQIFNNNVLLADQNGHDLVLIGRGLGFKQRPGNSVDKKKIQQIFSPTDKKWFEMFKELIEEIEPVYFEVSSQIINIATKQLQTNFSDYLLIALADHIHFAIERYNEGNIIQNKLLWEIKHYYPDEYTVGQQSLDLIQKKFSVNLPDDEAGFIGIKFVENQPNVTDKSSLTQTSELIHAIIQIVTYQLNITLTNDSLSFQRFITHVRFFATRLINHKKCQRLQAMTNSYTNM
ncbi:PRD domain-containing protein [Ligilactobacillus pobuzihii]|uniref:Transcription antiterminator n=1 Tax=Ligilactobacillus pobuzihii TaxID=449659 RepID=A0A0R2L9F1_9LACO|nr:PRD domain-containing protein [Ligilactobacillus pobuzihii]KRK08948.1 transcription antiterminator [Ligilactobacillus pobuzihii E100301 = KCTC 13174]KRN98441.1 transcription antiterminator [Ligilactobacillus pobuzihii]GEN49313.1 transcriptional antiterminator [Ligilactobacillus pobuzihii]